MTPPVLAVTVACCPSVTLPGLTVRSHVAESLSFRVMVARPISVPPRRAESAMLSPPSARSSSTAVTTALPEVVPAAMVMLDGTIV